MDFRKIFLGIRSDLEGFPLIVLYPMFSEEDTEFSEKLMIISTRAALNVQSGLIGDIRYFCWVYISIQPLLSGGILVGLLLSLVSLLKGDPKFLEGLLRDYNQCTGKYSPCLLLLSNLDVECLEGIYSLLSGGIYFSSCISFLMSQGERIK